MGSKLRVGLRYAFTVVTLVVTVTSALAADAASAAQIEWTRPLLKDYTRYAGWPTACQTSKGEILVVFSGDREAHVCPYGKVQLTRSQDGGETWSKVETICNGPIDDRDAGLIELKNGELLLFWFTSLAFHEYKDVAAKHPEYEKVYNALTDDQRRQALGSWARRSADGGKTWSEPVRVPVMTPHGGKLLKDGRILVIGVHDRQVEGMLTTDPNPPPKTISVAESTDGCSFCVIGQIPVDHLEPHWSLAEPTFYESQDGTLTALIRYELPKGGRPSNSNTYPRYMLRSTSTDGGKTWTRADYSNIDGYPPHVLRLRDGRLLCSYASRTVGRCGIYAAFSYDDGKTWDAAHEVRLWASENPDLGYSSTVENADGTLLTVYYANFEKDKPVTVVGTKWRPGTVHDLIPR